MSEDEDRSKLFLRLREKVDRAFKKYADAMVSFNNSNLDAQLKKIMDEKNVKYLNTLREFQFHFPTGKV
jgi:hypothetical protein